MRCLAATTLLLTFVCQIAFAQIQFPELTGRVVDNADLLDAQTERELTEMLAAHEKATTNQVVVVTLSTSILLVSGFSAGGLSSAPLNWR